MRVVVLFYVQFMYRRLLRLSDHGFTLIELLVVILIIAILIAISAPSFLGQTAKAQDSSAMQSLSISYKAAASIAVFNTPQGSWGATASDLCGSGAPINNQEPELHFQTSFPGSSHDSSSRQIIECSIASTTLTLTDLSDSGKVCTLTAPQSAAIIGPICTAAAAFVPQQVNPNSSSVNYFDPAWSEDGNTIYLSGADSVSGLTEIYSVPANSLGSTPTSVIDQSAPLDGGFNNLNLRIHDGVISFISDRGGALEVYSDLATDLPSNAPSATQVTSTGGTVNFQDLSGTLSTAPTNITFTGSTGDVYTVPVSASSSPGSDLGGGGSSGISPDGNTVVYVAPSGDVMTMPAGGGSSSLLSNDGAFLMSSGSFMSPTYSQDGSEVAFGANDGTDAYVIIVQSPTATSPGALVKKLDVGPIGTYGSPSDLQFSPDGSKILYDTANGFPLNVFVIPVS